MKTPSGAQIAFLVMPAKAALRHELPPACQSIFQQLLKLKSNFAKTQPQMSEDKTVLSQAMRHLCRLALLN